MQIIVFKLNGSHFAIKTDVVDEITKYYPSTKVPNAPFGVEGLINLRGNVMPQVNLTKLLKLDEDKDYKNIIVVNKDSNKIGLLINEVIKVMNIDETLIQVVGIEGKSGIIGVIEIEGNLVSVLDFTHLLLERFVNVK